MDETINFVICKKLVVGEGEVVKLREEGSERINRTSTERNDTIKTVPVQQQVHQKCWRDYCLKSRIAISPKPKSLRTPLHLKRIITIAH